MVNNRGETFVETLAAMLIITLVITGFSGVIANVSKMNKDIKETRVAFDKNYLTKAGYDSIEWNYTITTMADVEGNMTEDKTYYFKANKNYIHMYKDANKIYFYEYEEN